MNPAFSPTTFSIHDLDAPCVAVVVLINEDGAVARRIGDVLSCFDLLLDDPPTVSVVGKVVVADRLK